MIEALRRISRIGGTEGVEDGQLVEWDGMACASIARSALEEVSPTIDEDLKAMYVPYPTDLHPATAELVSQLAFRLAIKLRKAERKYGYSDGWRDDRWENDCRKALAEHVAKGDPLDVAAYCAFCLYHGWSTADPNLISTDEMANKEQS